MCVALWYPGAVIYQSLVGVCRVFTPRRFLAWTGYKNLMGADVPTRIIILLHVCMGSVVTLWTGVLEQGKGC